MLFFTVKTQTENDKGKYWERLKSLKVENKGFQE